MKLTSPHYFNENLQYFLAGTYVKLNEPEKAKVILNDLISKNLLKEQASKMLEELN